MKKLIALLMALAMVLALVACGGNNAGSASNPADSQPAAPVASSAEEILDKVWGTYAEDEMFPVMGGNTETIDWEGPSTMDIANTEELTYFLYLPTEQIGLVDEVANMLHAMNQNTFTGGCFHVADPANVQTVVDTLKDAIMNAQWMCGFPEQLVIITVGSDYVVSAFGNGELIDNFQAKLTAEYGEAAVVVVEENLM